MAKKQFSNPFYFLLVIVGIAFVVSACAYGVMAYRGVLPGAPLPDDGLMGFMDRHGMMLLGVEVILLGLFTVGAIGTDEFWQRRAQVPGAGERRKADSDASQSHAS